MLFTADLGLSQTGVVSWSVTQPDWCCFLVVDSAKRVLFPGRWLSQTGVVSWLAEQWCQVRSCPVSRATPPCIANSSRAVLGQASSCRLRSSCWSFAGTSRLKTERKTKRKKSLQTQTSLTVSNKDTDLSTLLNQEKIYGKKSRLVYCLFSEWAGLNAIENKAKTRFACTIEWSFRWSDEMMKYSWTVKPTYSLKHVVK